MSDNGMALYSRFKFGDKVIIDHGTVTGCVIGFCFYPHGVQLQVSWWNAGALIEQWIGEHRLEKVED